MVTLAFKKNDRRL